MEAIDTSQLSNVAPAIPVATPFDNQITMMYKWANYLGQPIRYLVLPAQTTTKQPGAQESTETFQQPAALMAVMLQMIQAGYPFATISDTLTSEYRITATTNDIAMIYFGLRGAGYDPSGPEQAQVFEELNRALGQNGYRDLGELQLSYQAWLERFQNRLDRDRRVLAGMIEIQQTLAELQPLHVSPVEINHVVVAVEPSIQSAGSGTRSVDQSVGLAGSGARSVDPTDGIDIFNAATVSNIVPYIQYNDSEGTKFYKVYEGSTETPTPDYSVVIQPTTQTNRRNTIYMTVWSGVGDIARATKESFMRAVWSLETNRLVVNAPVNQATGQNENLMVERLSQALTSNPLASGPLTLGPIHEVRVGGEFLMYDIEINDTSLLDAILIQPLMSTYLYVEEWTKPYAEKKRLYVHYKSLIGDNDPLGTSVDVDPINAGGDTDSIGAGSGTMVSAMSVSLNQRYAGDGETFVASIPSVNPNQPEAIGATSATSFTMPQGTPYLHINILRANDRSIIQQFITIVRRLMQFYRQIRNDIDQTYYSFIPGLARIDTTQRQQRQQEGTGTGTTAVGLAPQRKGRGRGAVKGKAENTVALVAPTVGGASHTVQDGFIVPRAQGSMSKIDQLQDLAPDLFVSGYARKCQCPLQPQIIGPNDVDAWRNKTFTMGGRVQERQIMPFPRDNPKWLFVCPSDSHPYPGVKRNKGLSNQDQYPYIPCCFKSDQMDPSKPRLKYNQYYRGMVAQPKNQPKTAHTIRTNKIPAPGRVGYVAKSISDLLRRYSEVAVDIVRYGVVHSPNSLIHCVCLATGNPQYAALLNASNVAPEVASAAAENFALAVRQQIVQSINVALLRQEMYDYADTEIQQHLADPTRFLDPYLYYRAVEELFGVNIYTFTLPREVGVTTTTDVTGELGSIEVPRYRLFRSQPIRPDRRTVVVLKHWGAESDNLSYPHCELLVDYDKDNNTLIPIFGPEMTQVCHDAILDVSRSITWSISTSTGAEAVSIPQLSARDNLYSWLDTGAILRRGGLIPVAQAIDSYGKLRAVRCTLPANQPGLNQGNTASPRGGTITVVCLPGQPLNVQRLSMDLIMDGQNFANPEIAVQIFGAPTSVIRSRRQEGRIEGLWFQLFDIPSGILVPVTGPSEEWADLPEGPANPITVYGSDPVARLKLLRRSSDLLLQLLIWLFLVAQSQGVLMSGVEFAQRYMAIGAPPVDTSRYYDFSRLPRRLPGVTTVEQGIQFMEAYVPTLFAQGRLVMYSPQLAVKLVEKLNEYQRNLLAPDTVVPTEIHGLYRESQDFNPQPNTAILVGERDLQGWLRSLNRPGIRNMMIRDRLDLAFGLSDEPYLYAIPVTGSEQVQVYMIQNVVAGDRDRALNVAREWYLNKVNLGYHADKPGPDVPTPVHVVFGISTAATPIPVEDLSGGNPQYLQLLTYGANQYAAMLPML